MAHEVCKDVGMANGKMGGQSSLLTQANHLLAKKVGDVRP